MYPLDAQAPYPRNQWYVGAYGSEITRQPFSRTLLDEPVVFYRTQSGEPVAVHGLCPHRFYPMDKAQVVEDALQCAYHGMVFDASGRCVRIPSQPEIPTSFRIRTFKVVEQGPLVWIWMGDPKLADSVPVPFADCLDAAEYEFTTTKVLHAKARVQLMIDNLFDLSHVDYLHAKTLPSSGLSSTALSMGEHEGRFRTIRSSVGQPYDGYATFLFGPGEGSLDFDVPTDFHGPGLIITGSIHHRGAKHGSATGGGAMRNVHCLTPETPRSCFYFGGFARNFRRGDDEFTKAYAAVDTAVRIEDLEGLEAVEVYADRYASVKAEMSVKADVGGVRIRRMIAELIRQETSAAAH